MSIIYLRVLSGRSIAYKHYIIIITELLEFKYIRDRSVINDRKGFYYIERLSSYSGTKLWKTVVRSRTRDFADRDEVIFLDWFTEDPASTASELRIKILTRGIQILFRVVSSWPGYVFMFVSIVSLSLDNTRTWTVLYTRDNISASCIQSA